VCNGNLLLFNPGGTLTGPLDGASNTGKKITVGSGWTVNGDVTSGGAIINGGTINGTTTPNGSPAVWAGYDLGFPAIQATLPKAKSSYAAGGTDIIDGAGGNTHTIGAGVHGQLTLGKNSTVKLSSGEYFSDGVFLGDGTEVEIDLSGRRGLPKPAPAAP